MSGTPKPSGGERTLDLLKRYWFPLVLAILATIFIVQNTQEIQIFFFAGTFTAPAWLAYTALVLVGLVVGLYIARRRSRGAGVGQGKRSAK